LNLDGAAPEPSFDYRAVSDAVVKEGEDFRSAVENGASSCCLDASDGFRACSTKSDRQREAGGNTDKRT
jgi:hypothetical protein